MRNLKIEKSAFSTLVLKFWPQSNHIFRFPEFWKKSKFDPPYCAVGWIKFNDFNNLGNLRTQIPYLVAKKYIWLNYKRCFKYFVKIFFIGNVNFELSCLIRVKKQAAPQQAMPQQDASRQLNHNKLHHASYSTTVGTTAATPQQLHNRLHHVSYITTGCITTDFGAICNGLPCCCLATVYVEPVMV